MAINWGLLGNQQGQFQNALAMGAQFGAAAAERKNQEGYRNALMNYDPSNPDSWKGVARYDVRAGMDLRNQTAEYADAQRKKAAEEMGTFRQLLEQAGENPQQALSAAQSLGIDISGVPPINSPEFEPWRQQQLFIHQAIEQEGDNLPGLAREVMFALPESQRDPNGPAFRQAFIAALENKYAAEYIDEEGNTRRRAIIGQSTSSPQQQPAAREFSFEQFQGAVSGLGPQGAAAWAQRNGIAVRVSTPQQAESLPSGTSIILPDGTEGRVP